MLKEWELFGAIVAGAPAIFSSDSVVAYSAMMPSGPQQQRSIKLTKSGSSSSSRSISGSTSGFLACLTSPWAAAGAASSGPAKVTVESVVSTRSDASAELSQYIPKTTVTCPDGDDPGSECIGAVLSAVWAQSALLWAKPFVSAVLESAGKLERTLPLATPMSRCFRVCLHLGARMARPAHVVKHMVRSEYGGSAVLTSAAFGSGASIVLNVELSTGKVAVKAKREGFRAVSSHRPIARNLEVMRGDQGWRRRTSDPDPLKRGALEQTLFIVTQCVVETLEKRE